jgi:AraC family transcriptional regulator
MNVAQTPVFTAHETHGRVLRPDNRLISHSQDAGWQSIYAAIFEEAPFTATEAPIGHPSLIYHIAHPIDVSRQIEGERLERALIGPRHFCLTPGGSNTLWEHRGHPEILQVYLRRSLFDGALEEMYGCDGSAADVVPRFAFTDPLLEQLAVAIITALREGSYEDRLYIETLAHMMAVHLARQHSTRVRPERIVAADKLSKPELRRLLEFIESHLGDDLSLEAMATEVDMSPYYLSRVFKGALGQSPHQYVLTRRVERAKSLLADTALPIADVALSVGFSSQSHLSTWFRRVVGVTPGTFRKAN